jgi:hypothetical protein
LQRQRRISRRFEMQGRFRRSSLECWSSAF